MRLRAGDANEIVDLICLDRVYAGPGGISVPLLRPSSVQVVPSSEPRITHVHGPGTCADDHARAITSMRSTSSGVSRPPGSTCAQPPVPGRSALVVELSSMKCSRFLREKVPPWLEAVETHRGIRVSRIPSVTNCAVRL